MGVEVSDEQVWKAATKVEGVGSLSTKDFQTLKKGLIVNPAEVELLVEHANQAKAPDRYFFSVLGRLATEGWPMAAPDGMGPATKEQALWQAADSAVRHLRRSETWETEQEWHQYTREALRALRVKGSDLRLSDEQIADLIASATGDVTLDEHTKTRLEREERLAAELVEQGPPEELLAHYRKITQADIPAPTDILTSDEVEAELEAQWDGKCASCGRDDLTLVEHEGVMICSVCFLRFA